MSDEKKNNTCVHCGADCGKFPVKSNGLLFCCHGCRTVYELLHENKLYTYYDLEKSPGIRLESKEHDSKYDFLDNEEIAARFYLFREAGVARVRFYIPVIHCASCIWLLENLSRLDRGIRYSVVNFPRKEVDITFDHTIISLRQLAELLSSLHYIPDLSQNLAEKREDGHSYKKLLYRIGVAGFAFLNVMTYSLPAYFNGKPVEGKLGTVLAVLSYLLTIPVVFYSGSDYLISASKNLRKKRISIDLPIAVGILVLFLVTSYEVMSCRGPGYSDSLSGLVFFLLAGKWYQGKSYEALSFERNYKSFFPIAVTKINKQVEESILLEKIEPGDILLIRSRELIPADAILTEGRGLIDYSFVTGESNPVVKKAGDFLYAGGRQMGGIIRIRVEKEVVQSHLTQLWNQDKSYENPRNSIKNLTDHISRYFILVVLLIAAGGFTGWALTGDWHKAVFVFTAVLIIACPCALALSAPFTFGNAMRIFGRRGLYVKNTSVIEKLAHVNTIVFDKTGTLTKPDENAVDFCGRTLVPEELDALLSLSRQSPHPMSMAIATYLKDAVYIEPEHFTEVEGRGVFGKVNGLMVHYGSGEFIQGRNPAQSPGASLVFLKINGQEAGYFKISNRYRENLDNIMASLQTKFDLYLVSGDNDAEKDNLIRYFKPDNMHFNCNPRDKTGFVKTLQEKGALVLMTGDGLNDAGALMQSDVALTVANKVYQFSPASDAVLEAGKFGMLSGFIRFTHTARNIVYTSFIISLLYNILGIGIALSGILSPVIAAVLMPASSVSVVAFATFATRLAGKFQLK